MTFPYNSKVAEIFQLRASAILKDCTVRANILINAIIKGQLLGMRQTVEKGFSTEGKEKYSISITTG